MFQRLLVCLLCLASSCITPEQGEYPARGLTLIVPWSPGGGTDTVSRALASALSDQLGESVTIVNRTGGGGVIGHLALASAAPDGYTIGAVTVEITMMHWAGITDLTPADYSLLALVTNNPGAITVRTDSPWQSVDGLVAALKANPGVHFASGTSKGGIWDLARIGFLERAGLPQDAMPWIPSQGAAPGLQELLAGGVDVVTAAFAETDALRKNGRVRVLAVMAPERLPAAPEIPTLKELGIDWSIGGWSVISAPSGLDGAANDTLRAALRRAVRTDAFRGPLLNAGFNLEYKDGETLDRFIAEQDSTNGALLAASL